MESEFPIWDESLAQRLNGALVLVGMTFVHPDGTTQEQFYGRVEQADAVKGIALRLAGERAGELYNLPPDMRAFTTAGPGVYTLRGTGEQVEDPDYTCTWTINAPRN